MNYFLSLIRITRLFAVIAAIGILTGCATVHDMAVNKSTTELNLDGKGLLLLSMEVSNQYKPDYQPQIIVAHVEVPNADSKEQRHNFKTDLDGTISSSGGTRYLLRMELPAGQYVIRGATCMYHSLFLMGSCLLPLHADITVTPNSIAYLGRVSGVMRERKDDEFRAGPPIPLVDQAVTGFSSSTFDVVISDEQGEDLKSYRMLFPALTHANIETRILPPFDRARAQTWWETDGNSEKISTEAKATQTQPES